MKNYFFQLQLIKSHCLAEQPKASLEVVKKDEKAVVEVPSLEKRIQKVEDLSMPIEKWRKLTDPRRSLQTFSLVLMEWVPPYSSRMLLVRSLKHPIRQ